MELKPAKLEFLKVKSSLTGSIFRKQEFLTETSTHIITETLTHPNPYCELAKRTRKHHAGVDEPPCRSEHNTTTRSELLLHH